MAHFKAVSSIFRNDLELLNSPLATILDFMNAIRHDSSNRQSPGTWLILFERITLKAHFKSFISNLRNAIKLLHSLYRTILDFTSNSVTVGEIYQ